MCEDDQKEFLNGWYVLVIVGDLLAIIGSVLKIEIQAKVQVNLRCPLEGAICTEPLGKASTDPPPPTGPDQLRCVQHLPGNLHAAGVGQRHQVPGVLREIQRRSRSLSSRLAPSCLFIL